MKQNEHLEAAALMRAVGILGPPYTLIYHIPNGGMRHKAVACKLKAEGVRAGIADYFYPRMRGGFGGLYIELKAQGGKPSSAQISFLMAAAAEGYATAICYGWLEAYQALKRYEALGG